MKKVTRLLAFLSIINCSIFAEENSFIDDAHNIGLSQLVFIKNKGQVLDLDGKLRPDIKYTAQSNGTRLFFSETGIYYQFQKSESKKAFLAKQNTVGKKIGLDSKSDAQIYRLDMQLVGANHNANIREEGITGYFENYYMAHCPQGITGVQSYSKIIYENVYPKIDWVIYSKDNNLEYDFIVHPGGDPNAIKIKYNFAQNISITENGSVKIKTSLGEVAEAAPYTYISENRKVIDSKFILENSTLQFEIKNYNPTQTLVIDPVLIWSSYYGGNNVDVGLGCSSDVNGNVFVAGYTESTSAIASGGFQNNLSSPSDGFFAKLDSVGNRLWATYFGSSDEDVINACAADKNGNLFIVGYTESFSGISSAGSFQANFGGGQYDAFIGKFNSQGARNWSSYYGGTDDDIAYDCMIDPSGNFCFTGTSLSTNGIASSGVGMNQINGGYYTSYLSKFLTNGTRAWGTYFGDSGDERAFGCASDKLGNLYIAGYAQGSSFMGIGGFLGSPQGSFDAYLTKFNSNGLVVWATYYGTIDNDIALACATDSSNNVYLAGRTNSSFGIAASGFQNNFGGGSDDGYLVKFDENCARLWATYTGGNGYDLAQACATDKYQNVVVCGSTSSANAIASGGFQNSYGGGTQDAFAISFGPNGTRIFGSYLGGSNEEYGNDCTINNSNNIFIAGETASLNFPTAGTVHQASYGGGTKDAFVAKIESPCASISTTISYNGTPYACALSTFLLHAPSGLNYNYQWQRNGAIIGGAINSSFTATQGGFYRVIINQNGVCQDTSLAVFLDSVPPSVPICIATVDSLSKFNLLIWEKPMSTIIDKFNIYREDITNIFSFVKSVNYNQLSLFIDSNLLFANPNATSKLYKISTVDVCGVESPKSLFHHTIKLNDQQNGNFDWNFYQIEGQVTPVLQYILLRDSMALDIWTPIAITSGNINSMSDMDYNLYPNARYRLVTNMGTLNCEPTLRVLSSFNTSKSNIKNKSSVGIISKDEALKQIYITPNPTSGYFQVNNMGNEKINAIKVYDKLGRLIISFPAQKFVSTNTTIDISYLAPALYTLVVETNQFILTKKLLKN
jgi:hypothetical protein